MSEDNNTAPNLPKQEAVSCSTTSQKQTSTPTGIRALSLSPTIPEERLEQSNEQFLQLNAEMRQKLDRMDKARGERAGGKGKVGGVLKKVKLGKKEANRSLQVGEGSKAGQSKVVDRKVSRQAEQQIKRQFVDKLKEWSRQRQQLQYKKQQISERRARVREQQEQRRWREKQQQQQFTKLQRRKQIEQKISEIEQRRRKREESLRNAVQRQSQSGVPKYIECEAKFSAKEQQAALLSAKLMRNKREKMTMDADELRAHEKAYIDRLKQRLNMGRRAVDQRRTNSDFNLHLQRSEERKRAELEKIVRRRKFQEKVSRMPVKIDEEKKREVLISIDKTRHPQKYHLLGQKALNDEQIYRQFKDFDISLDPKRIGDDYLNQLQAVPNRKKARSQQNLHSNIINTAQSLVLPKVTREVCAKPKSLTDRNRKEVQVERIEQARVQQSRRTAGNGKGQLVVPVVVKVRSSLELGEGKAYERGLQKAKQRDSKYLRDLRQKLAFLD